MIRFTVFVALLIAVSSVRAEAKLNGIFADHMVLQREQPGSVWGTSAPGETVTVTFAAQSQTAHATPPATGASISLR